ncbi:uncharacterized protein LOC128880245 isoform X1 [Hylaeus volcanicus]|uniref:uncharacterized protein LOC128880245 isoform X1 n=2 Tax=Hylaeus volcanicus TaxID=313075 RepID=UPI0023B7D3AF|nr:uncharacterized protein LOC128880245 isoform X1 [Hylaeus volcanicus]
MCLTNWNQLSSKNKNLNFYKKMFRIKREHEVDTTSVYVEETEPGEEVYDYEKFKKEYDEQIARYTTTDKISNYTNGNTSEETQRKKYPAETLQKLFDFKNCTEASKKFGIKAIDCLVDNYERQKPALKKSVQKVWLMIRVWFLIYICLAIPCWCQKGWCCWCFRCKVCFPRTRILFAKQYYALNPPGVLAKEVKKKEEAQQFITYEPTEFEEDAFEQFETAIRNI